MSSVKLKYRSYHPDLQLFERSLLSSISLPNAPSGAVISIDSKSTVRTMLPPESHLVRGI